MTRSPALWGDAARAIGADEVEDLATLLRARFPDAELRYQPPAPLGAVTVPEPRIDPPRALSSICSTARDDRLLHAVGRSYTDLVQARRGDYGTPPDVVAMPRDADEVTAVLEWAEAAGAAVVPFGGGTSVVDGVRPPTGDRPVITLQTRRMNKVLDVDTTSRAAHIAAGATGPQLEDQLRATALTLRFYPQSFEFSTLGGWIATRAGGHYATRLTHIDDLVEAVTAVTPIGLWTSRRLPASGAGPSPDRLLLGSEGTLGVITDAWMRLQQRPVHRAGGSVTFGSFAAGAQAVRTIVQSGLDPAGCRLLDAEEAALSGAGDGTVAVLVLGFESGHHPVDHLLDLALDQCRDAGGTPVPPTPADPSARWRDTFLAAPYLRDALIGLGAVVETFETAATWDRFDALVHRVIEATQAAVAAMCGDGIVTCRITHAYPDGAAPYFTVIAPARRGSETQQWAQIKDAASAAIAEAGGTTTHHHAVGRDHRAWYDEQRPAPFAAALAAAKRAVDPQWRLNPGILLDPR